MNKYINALKKLQKNFSYDEFINLLQIVDEKIIDGINLNAEFI